MKKFVLSMFLILTLITSVFVPVSADSELKVGYQTEGFTLCETGNCKIYDASTYLFVHDKTGGKVLYVANDDVNRGFDIAFNTPADSTGVSHVFEHASLNGSDKYPSNVFFNVNVETINTYMNASTSEKYTYYPISSISDEQLLKLADYYLDGVFNPLIMKDKNIFEQEAWRYELASPDSELTLNGTVYSEMKGGLSPERRSVFDAFNLLYPGSNTSVISGGDPDMIPSLTYEDLTDYHDKYYHPSNSLVVLYGKVDYQKYLDLVDSYFSKYDKKEIKIDDPHYKPISGNVEKTFKMQATKNTGNTVFYLIPCDISSKEELFDFIFCADFLNSESSDLMQTLNSEMPHASVGIEAQFSVGVKPTLLISAYNIQPGEEHKLKQIIDSSLKKISQNGFSEKFTDAFLTSLEREFLTLPDSSGNKAISVISSINSLWSVDGNESLYFDYLDYILNIDSDRINKEYKELIRKHFADPQTSAFAINEPDTSIAESKDAELKEKLKNIKSEMSDEQIAQIVARTLNGNVNTSNPDLVKEINVSNVDILRNDLDSYKPKQYPFTDETQDGVRYLNSSVDIGDIGYGSVYLDVSSLTDEQLLYLNLFDEVNLKFGTQNHSQAEIYDLVVRYISGNNAFLPTDDDTLYVVYNMTMINDDIEKTYDVLYEWLYETKIDDAEYLKSLIDSSVNSWETSVISNSLLIARAKAQKDKRAAYSSYLGGLDYYEFLKMVRAKLDSDPDEVLNEIRTVQSILKNKYNAKVVFAGNDEGIRLNQKYSKEFFDKLPNTEASKPQRNIPVSNGDEAIISNSDVNYNMIFATFDDLGIQRDASLNVTLNMMYDKFFIPYFRNEKGAYDMSLGLDNLGFYICTYRDPQIASTFEYYDKLGDLLDDNDFTQDDIDGYIMSSFSKKAIQKKGTLSDVFAYLKSQIYFNDKQLYDTLSETLNTTPQKVKSYADMFHRMSEIGIRGTVGRKSDIVANMSEYDSITDPFPDADAIKIYYNGKLIISDVDPIMENDRVLVPMRSVFEAMGCSVEWFESDQKITVSKNDITVVLYIGSDKMYINGDEIKLDVPARLTGNRTYIPARAVSEALSCKVDWDEKDNSVIITDQ